MKMITTCPACATSFRIQRHQIDARGGQVRCGHCGAVFDAHMHLQVEAELPPPMEISLPADEAAAASVLPPVEEPVKEIVHFIPDSQPPLLEEFDFGRPVKERSPWSTTFWTLAALVCGLALMAQLLYHFRGDVALYLPQLQPVLQEACAPLGCNIPLPQRAELVSIEADEMQLDPAQPELLLLTAVLRNRAPFDQAYPIIELTLTDDAQATVSRRVLKPADYLSERLRRSPVFAANSETTLKLYIDAAGLAATGYRMEVLYL
jgi:predicted Zn finger-like uncharacterized protein